jgi:hypothetical protein
MPYAIYKYMIEYGNCMHTQLSNNLTISSDCFLTAMCKAVLPRLVSWQLMSAPLASSNSTLLTFIAFTAICKGVRPKYLKINVCAEINYAEVMLTSVISRIQL